MPNTVKCQSGLPVSLSSCMQMEGTGSFHWTLYSFSPEDEYEAVVFLPKGSRNIKVVKRGKARHFIGKYFVFDAISLARFFVCFVLHDSIS